MHAAGRARARQLAPEHRRQVEADQIVERAAGEIGVHQRDVDVARIAHGIEHGRLGDGVEDDALDRLVADDALLLEHVQNVPGNRFTLAIRVGRENEAVGGFHRVGDVLHALGRGAVHFPGHLEVLVRAHGAVLGGQVADMAEGGQHLVAGAEILVDRLGLGRRFHNYNIHRHFL